MKYHWLDGVSPTAFPTGLGEIAGVPTGDKVGSLESECIGTIMEFKLTAHGAVFKASLKSLTSPPLSIFTYMISEKILSLFIIL
jgi:hypothetical protein